MEKKIFIVLCSILIIGFLGWKIFIDQKQNAYLESLNNELQVNSEKLLAARNAKMNLEQVRKKFEAEQKNLAKAQGRFINKNDLSTVAQNLNKTAKSYDIKMMDFAPVLDKYFSDISSAKIIALPINIAFHGSYLSIGKYIENWSELPFYLIADEISIYRVNPNQNLIRAEIIAKLYTWNE